MPPVVASWLLPRFFVENLLVDCITGMCCAGFGLANEMKPMKRFEEPDHKAWLLSGLTPPAQGPESWPLHLSGPCARLMSYHVVWSFCEASCHRGASSLDPDLGTRCDLSLLTSKASPNVLL